MSDMKNGACSRLPINRPCMSVITRSTVSMLPCSTSARSSSRVTVVLSACGLGGAGHSYTGGGMDRNSPIVGITAYEVAASFSHWRDMESVMAPAGYSHAVGTAGGIPVLIPPLPSTVQLLDHLDGLVFSGGSDLGASLYGQVQHPDTLGVIPHRDRAELALLEAALERGMPVLGVCRGMQLINVALGGTLHQ